MRLTKIHIRILDSFIPWLGCYRHVCVRGILSAVFLALFALPCAWSQVASAISPMGDQARQLYQAGLALVGSGHIDQAIGKFKQGLEIAPGDKALLDAAGAAYSMRGELEAARDYFIASLKVDPDFAPAKQNLGIALFSLGHYAEAEDQFKSLQNQSGQSYPVSNLFLGMIAEKRSDCKAALLLMENAEPLLNKYPDAELSFANCEIQIGDPQRARQMLSAFDQTPGKSSSQYKQAADLYTRLGQNRQALAELSKARSDKEQAAITEEKRAGLLEKTGRLDEAQRALENLVASRATEDLLLDLARVAKERGDLPVAMKSLRRASQIEPDREDSYLEFSTICADRGNDALALETTEIGLGHVPGSYRLTVQKGAVLEKLGRLNDAEETLRKAIGIQKDNSIALLSLAVVQAHSGRLAEAEQTLENAVRQSPDNYYMYYFRGTLLSKLASTNSNEAGLKDAAIRSLQQAIRLNPDYADSYYQISELYKPTAPTLAEQSLQKCLRLNPRHSPAEYSLARLYLRNGKTAEGQALLARFKTQQRAEEMQQQKQLLIEAAHD